MKILLIICILTSLNLSHIHSQTKDKYYSIEEDIQTLFNLNGSKTAYITLMNNMINNFNKENKNDPEWKAYSNIFKESSVDELIEMLIPIYKKNFTHQDIKELIIFYKSPIGQKLANKSTIMTEESMTIGMKWGKCVHDKLKIQIKNKGYKLRLPFSGSY